MKYKALLIGILLAVFVLSATGTDQQDRPIIKKTSLDVRVRQLEQRVDDLEKDNKTLIMAKMQHEQDIRQLQSKLHVTPRRRR